MPGIDEVRAVKKRLFLDVDHLQVVVHFLIYGSYRLNVARDLDCGEDIETADLGATDRVSYWCPACQIMENAANE